MRRSPSQGRLHQVPDGRKPRLDPIQVAPVVPAGVGHTEEAVLLEEVLRRGLCNPPDPRKSARVGLDLPKPCKRCIPEDDDVLRGESGDLRGKDLPGAHPDKIGRDSRFSVLPEDALHRIDQEEPLPSEELQILPARLPVEPEQPEEVLGKPARERRHRPAVPRIVAVVPEVGVVGALAVAGPENLLPPGGPGRGLSDEERLHAAGPAVRGAAGHVGQEPRQDDPPELRPAGSIPQVDLCSTHR
jgi:hypothetical protein